MKPSVCAVVPARGGSKGLPGKNLKYINGHPLIAHSIRHAQGARCVDRVLVSTDSAELARIAFEYEAEVPFLRPKLLSGDRALVVDAIEHLLESLAYAPDFVALLQPTSPLRTALDIDRAFAQLCADDRDAVISVCEAASHPYLCKALGEEGELKPFIESPRHAAHRQELPPAYALNGAVYIIRTQVLLETRNWCPPDTAAYVMPAERSVDIDHALDFEWAEWLLQRLADEMAA